MTEVGTTSEADNTKENKIVPASVLQIPLVSFIEISKKRSP